MASETFPVTCVQKMKKWGSLEFFLNGAEVSLPGRYTPLGRYTPWAGTLPLAGTPGQVHPWAGTPPRQVHPPGLVHPGQVHPPGRYTPWDVVLLECILVFHCIHLKNI